MSNRKLKPFRKVRITGISKSSSPSLLYASLLARRFPWASPASLYFVFDTWTGELLDRFTSPKSAVFQCRLLSRLVPFSSSRFRVVRYTTDNTNTHTNNEVKR